MNEKFLIIDEETSSVMIPHIIPMDRNSAKVTKGMLAEAVDSPFDIVLIEYNILP